ncbi:MAG: hypothetical protein PWQ61_1741 [Betaproteobacteria bacterium]|nr:hypothetical protein [Betaproteobacteria bacterium]
MSRCSRQELLGWRFIRTGDRLLDPAPCRTSRHRLQDRSSTCSSSKRDVEEQPIADRPTCARARQPGKAGLTAIVQVTISIAMTYRTMLFTFAVSLACGVAMPAWSEDTPSNMSPGVDDPLAGPRTAIANGAWVHAVTLLEEARRSGVDSAVGAGPCTPRRVGVHGRGVSDAAPPR